MVSQVSLPMPDCHAFVFVCLFVCLFFKCLPFCKCLANSSEMWLCYYNLNCMLFLVMGFISLVDEIQFMLISSCHIHIRSIEVVFFNRYKSVFSLSFPFSTASGVTVLYKQFLCQENVQ